ncbi:hypothetical protein ATANTOWER_003814 [Ataeniobius toweri]|uniref:Secreted protein n=1 Tax=Ataeniobius toweri TaxID=208326 RepID=A0ABU7BFG2_9TELE|nr:hypothetical protein [Ataeniobius toweri]
MFRVAILLNLNLWPNLDCFYSPGLTILPVTAEEKCHHTMMLPPSTFTMSSLLQRCNNITRRIPLPAFKHL